MADDRPIVYEDDGVWVYRASSVGACVRALVAAGMGYQTHDPAYLIRAAEEGNLHEPDIINKVRAMGVGVAESQDVVEVPVVKDKVIIRGHVDGVAYGDLNTLDGLLNWHPTDHDKAVVEAKTMSRKVFETWQRNRFDSKIEYAYQVSVYMHAMGDIPAIYAVKRRDDGLMEYTWIEDPPVAWETIRRKVLEAERWRRKGELPPCDQGQKWGCPFWFLHDEADTERLHLDGDVADKINEFAATYTDMKASAKEADGYAKAARERLQTLMGGYARVSTDLFDVTWVTQQRMSFDWQQLEKDIIAGEMDETLDRYKKPYTVEFPKITQKG